MSLRKHPRLRGEDLSQRRARAAPEETPPLTRGRPRRLAAYQWAKWKHPRLRGEDAPISRSPPMKAETPPLTRGRQWRHRKGSGLRGNTPAYAGKTACWRSSCWPQRKHPRLRGEDFGVKSTRSESAETPPLTRGRLPRSAVALQTAETPPLTRGRLVFGESEDGGHGNTPAYAGKTPAKNTRHGGPEKHPRLRGED